MFAAIRPEHHDIFILIQKFLNLAASFREMQNPPLNSRLQIFLPNENVRGRIRPMCQKSLRTGQLYITAKLTDVIGAVIEEER